MPDNKIKARIEVFRTGTFTPMRGKAISFTAADLRAVADAYDPDTAPAPIVVGHPSTDAPAFGWVEGFDYDAGTDRLSSTLTDIAPEFAAAVKAGRYRKVSLAFFPPDHPANPAAGSWYPKHLGFLGGAAPAVPGLKNVQFSGDDEGVVTFSQSLPARSGFDMAGLIASFAEFLAGQGGNSPAPVRIDWEDAAPDAEAETNPAPKTTPEKEKPVSNPTDTQAESDLAAKEKAIADREAALAEREAKARHDDNAAFAEGLVNEGKLIAVSKDAVVALLDQLAEDSTQSVAFAAGGDKLSPAEALRKVLADQPKAVDFSALEHKTDDVPPAHFAADGQPVDAEGLELLAKAQAYQAKHEGVGIVEAALAVQKGA